MAWTRGRIRDGSAAAAINRMMALAAFAAIIAYLVWLTGDNGASSAKRLKVYALAG